MSEVKAYFFIIDFLHLKKSNDETDLLMDSIVYFYPDKEEIKKQKLLECGERIGLFQYFSYDLFKTSTIHFQCRKSRVVCKNYGSKCAFFVADRTRITYEEARLHLERILTLFHFLYGTFNDVQTKYSDNVQLQLFLRKTLTPIADYVFNLNRTVENLFHSIHYASLNSNVRCSILQVKQLLADLQSVFQISSGLIACRGKILYSNFDLDLTSNLQTILNFVNRLPPDLSKFPLKFDSKLKSGVNLLRCYLVKSLPAQVQPVQSESTVPIWSRSISESVDIVNPSFSSPFSFSSIRSDRWNLTTPSISVSEKEGSITLRNSAFRTTSSEDPQTNTDQTEDPEPEETLQNNAKSSMDNPLFEHQISNGPFSYSYEDSTSDKGQPADEKITMVPIDGEMLEEDSPLISSESNMHRSPHSSSFKFQNSIKLDRKTWRNIPETNDEQERELFVLYIQRNSRMSFIAIIQQEILSAEYLNNLWFHTMSEMAKIDSEIDLQPSAKVKQPIPRCTEFQYHETTGRTEFRNPVELNSSSSSTPSIDNALMAFNAQSSLRNRPRCRTIGYSRGANVVTADRTRPGRTRFIFF